MKTLLKCTLEIRENNILYCVKEQDLEWFPRGDFQISCVSSECSPDLKGQKILLRGTNEDKDRRIGHVWSDNVAEELTYYLDVLSIAVGHRYDELFPDEEPKPGIYKDLKVEVSTDEINWRQRYLYLVREFGNTRFITWADKKTGKETHYNPIESENWSHCRTIKPRLNITIHEEEGYRIFKAELEEE